MEDGSAFALEALVEPLRPVEPEAMTTAPGRGRPPFDLVEKHGGSLWPRRSAAPRFLGNPGVGAMIAHHAMLYRDLADPVALLKG